MPSMTKTHNAKRESQLAQEQPMSLRSNVTRSRFSDYHEEALRDILALGVTPAQMETLMGYGLLAEDSVTGYYEGRSGTGRISTLQRAIQHVRRTGEPAFYVEMDFQNLGGLNAALGHSGANEVYKEVAAIARQELSAVASEATFFRHGGDETSAFLVNTTGPCVRAAMEVIRQQVVKFARDKNLHEIPHGKDRHCDCLRGIGVHFGLCEVSAEYEQNPMLVFRMADTELERGKKALHLKPLRSS
jgi:GGDEF domain-containing protein